MSGIRSVLVPLVDLHVDIVPIDDEAVYWQKQG